MGECKRRNELINHLEYEHELKRLDTLISIAKNNLIKYKDTSEIEIIEREIADLERARQDLIKLQNKN
ncbi:MAG: hypothetical protein IJZ29_03455 [Clostridia bacterium]|nr:hypothetical protein [Clostridia bacterium]